MPPADETRPPSEFHDLIVFDDKCVVCSGFARFMARRDKTVGYRFVSAHSQTGRMIYRKFSLDPDLMETNIVVRNNRPFVKMAAFSQAVGSLGWPWRCVLVLNLLPKPVSDWLYDRIARNRYRFGRQSCPVPSEALRARLVD